MHTDIDVRRASAVDRPGLEDAIRSDATFRDDEVAVALELIDDALAHGDCDYWLRVAVLDGQLAGYICFGPTPMTASTYDLYWVVTHANYRGRGIGRMLIAAMERELKDCAATAIRVETSQTDGYGAARTLYDRCGYPMAARFADFYRDNDDLIVYYKRL